MMQQRQEQDYQIPQAGAHSAKNNVSHESILGDNVVDSIAPQVKSPPVQSHLLAQHRQLNDKIPSPQGNSANYHELNGVHQLSSSMPLPSNTSSMQRVVSPQSTFSQGISHSGSVVQSSALATTIRVCSASHAVGTSLIATLLSLELLRHKRQVALVDCDFPCGMLDVLLGIEEHEGLRWEDITAPLGSIECHVLLNELLQYEGLPIVSTSSVVRSVELWELQAVFQALLGNMEYVVCDGLPPMCDDTDGLQRHDKSNSFALSNQEHTRNHAEVHHGRSHHISPYFQDTSMLQSHSMINALTSDSVTIILVELTMMGLARAKNLLLSINTLMDNNSLGNHECYVYATCCSARRNRVGSDDIDYAQRYLECNFSGVIPWDKTLARNIANGLGVYGCGKSLQRCIRHIYNTVTMAV